MTNEDRTVVQLLDALADRLEQRASQISGNSDLDATAPDRAEPLYIIAAEIRALVAFVKSA